MIEIVFASNNAHKVYEVNQIAEGFGVRFVKPKEGFDPIENGLTFEKNAIIKAHAAAALEEPQSGKLYLADDSGLCVEYLNGAPGLHSARYANGQAASIEKLLKEMEGASVGERAAKFVCSMVLTNARGEILHKTEGVCKGRIGFEPMGKNGFGYDPIFLLQDGRTMAQLLNEEKNMISHRARALIDMLIWVKLNKEALVTAQV